MTPTSAASFSHDFRFDPTYGYDLKALRAVPAPEAPNDFEEFWRRLYEEARAGPPAPTLRLADGGTDDIEIFDVAFTALGGLRLGGWLTKPRHEPVTRGVVVGHGYGGREQPDINLPMEGAAAIFPCARGMSRSRQAGIPDHAAAHVLHGIESRETYVHGGCAADLWAAASALIELLPEAARRLDYIGGSFGGGIGALALPWDARFHSAHLSVPSFGNHLLRLTLPCTGSGEAVRLYHRSRPEVTNVLRYFDAATAASHIRIPTFVAAALFDPAVPPPGQFAVYNALPGPKELFVLQAGHFEHPAAAAENAALFEALPVFRDNIRKVIL